MHLQLNYFLPKVPTAHPAFLSFIFTLLSVFSQAYSFELDSILVEAEKSARIISSAEFKMTSTDYHSAGNSEKREKCVSESHFYTQGNMFRCEVELTNSATNKVLRSTMAYNGVRYQTFMPDASVLALSNASQVSNPTFGINCLIAPYMWIFDGQRPFSWSIVRDHTAWDRASSKATLLRTVEEGGNTLHVVSFASESVPGVTSEVFFAENLAFFPLRFITRGIGKAKFELRVDEFEQFQTDGDTVYVPIKITLQEDGGEIQHRGTYRIRRESLKINVPLDEELFTISRSRARIVNDLDDVDFQNLMSNLPSSADLSSKTTGPQAQRFWFILFNIALIISISVMIIARRGSKHAESK